MRLRNTLNYLFIFNCLMLIHLFPIHTFSTSWKHQKTLWFSDVFKDVRKGAFGTNGFIYFFMPWLLFILNLVKPWFHAEFSQNVLERITPGSNWFFTSLKNRFLDIYNQVKRKLSLKTRVIYYLGKMRRIFVLSRRKFYEHINNWRQLFKQTMIVTISKLLVALHKNRFVLRSTSKDVCFWSADGWQKGQYTADGWIFSMLAGQYSYIFFLLSSYSLTLSCILCEHSKIFKVCLVILQH